MEISRNGVVLTNDQIQLAGTLTYGGALTVVNLGPTALAVGNNFKLFAASSYLGAFSNLALPAPGVGLGWTNKLLLDGSIEVVAAPSVFEFVAEDSEEFFVRPARRLHRNEQHRPPVSDEGHRREFGGFVNPWNARAADRSRRSSK
jgi:hypothetical protein